MKARKAKIWVGWSDMWYAVRNGHCEELTIFANEPYWRSRPNDGMHETGWWDTQSYLDDEVEICTKEFVKAFGKDFLPQSPTELVEIELNPKEITRWIPNDD